ncbi:glycine receptor subunit alpha-3 [Rhipicephalus sanguineus]|uniref:glycine receptor subunit alpha-3 n=1 Tax=Rhipicephalus sanguineus TaxID=34632 RepID=UPI001895F3B2|nr:glycine receptor subunit alpha-3 [Rhipicephalus sanguineus]
MSRPGRLPWNGTLALFIATAAAAYVSADARRNNMRANENLDISSILPENPQDYDNLAPPKEHGRATSVKFHVTVLSLDSIDEGSMTYVADIFMSQSWYDHRLRLPRNVTSKYRLLPVNWLHQMWRPDSFFKNAKRVTFQEMTIPNHYIWLYSDGSILYMVKLTLLLSCAMKFETYPHDTQVCTMKIESLSYTTDDLVFSWDDNVPLVVDDAIELPQHNLVETALSDCTTVYSTGNFTCIQVTFTLKRRLGYYMFHTYIPTCLIVIMSWISFWIKPEAVPARVTLCVTSLLTLSTQHAQSQKSLPPVSYIKAIDIFMSSCTVFVFASLMEYALVNILMGETDESLVYRKARPVNIAAKVTESRRLSNGAPTQKIETAPSSTGLPRRRDRALLVDKISRVVFPLSFVILNTVYWSVYLDYP